jgi:hypothetical protein
MADYMLLMRNEGIPMMDISDEEKNKTMKEWGAWMGGLQEQGKLKGGLPFNPAVASVINSKMEVSEGFHSHGNNINVGGFIHLEAANIEEAIEIAKGCPGLHGENSTIEVREFMDM